MKNQQLEQGIAPPKINIEPENDGLVQMIFLSKWVNFRFHVNPLGCNGKCKRIYNYQLTTPQSIPKSGFFSLGETHVLPFFLGGV